MSSPNIEALERLLSEAEGQVPGGRKAKLVSPIATRVLAEWLASRGVLVISKAVLTDDVCERVVHGGPEGYEADWEAAPEELRARLAQLAKGQ